MRHIPGRLLIVTAVAALAGLAWPRSPWRGERGIRATAGGRVGAR